MTVWTEPDDSPNDDPMPRGRPPLDVDRDRWNALVALNRALRKQEQAKAKSQDTVQAAVDRARECKVTWQEIADTVGLNSRQEAQRRFGHRKGH
jgi:gluconate kinase